MEERADDLAETITREEGKVIAEGRAEVQRAVQTITLSQRRPSASTVRPSRWILRLAW